MTWLHRILGLSGATSAPAPRRAATPGPGESPPLEGTAAARPGPGRDGLAPPTRPDFICSTCGRDDQPPAGDWDPPICLECDAAISFDALEEEGLHRDD